jgi:hypothetical protein
MLFHAWRLFERFLWFYPDDPLSEEETEIALYACVYLSCKYFTTLTITPHWRELVPKKYHDDKSMATARVTERFVIETGFQFVLFTPTVYEVADDFGVILEHTQIKDILQKIVNDKKHFGKTPSQFMEEYLKTNDM